MFEVITVHGEPFEEPATKPPSARLLSVLRSAVLRATMRKVTRVALALSLAVVAAVMLGSWAKRSLLLETRANHGEANAQYWLGRAQFNSAQTPDDYQQAISWLRKAAGQKHAAAQLSLGLIYAKGMGVPRNSREALKWFREAAANGRQEASRSSRHPLVRTLASLLPGSKDRAAWAVDLAKKNLEMAAAANANAPGQITASNGIQYRSVRLQKIQPESVLLEFLAPGNAGMAKLKRQALPEDLSRLCDYSEETGVVPFSVWRQPQPGLIAFILRPNAS